jgi:protein-S-isoprenylcysteine O-methyltransferase Ste14
MAETARLDRSQLFALVRTGVFFLLVPGTLGGYLPYRVLGAPPIPPLSDFAASQWAGTVMVALGLVGLLWCGWEFATRGRGTPAPFDAPKALVARGPYRWVRNPMYVSVATAVAGEALFFWSRVLLQYLAIGWVFFHLFVLGYEEPTLREKFGAEYEAYCKAVPRWIPRAPRNR